MTIAWFNEMFTISREQPLTGTQHFSFWSALVSYVGGGLSMILAPDLWNVLFGFDVSARGRGYFFLLGVGLVIIGFFFLVNSRARPRVPGQGVLLASVPARIVFVNWRLVVLFNQGVVTLPFVLTFSFVDSGLALVTYNIWFRETERASSSKFLVEIWKTICPIPSHGKNYIFTVFQCMGFFHMIIGFTFHASPDWLVDIVAMDAPQSPHTKGLLSTYLLMFTLHGWMTALAGGAGNYPTLIGAIFYRVAWNIPCLSLAGLTSIIEPGLATVLVLFDALCVFIVAVLLILGQERVKEK